MTNPIEKAKDLSQSLYLAGKATETQDILNDLIDYAEDLEAVLENLLTAADGITPTQEEFLAGKARISVPDWDDWDEVVKEAKEVLTND